MGRKNNQNRKKKKNKKKNNAIDDACSNNFFQEAGPGCYIARRGDGKNCKIPHGSNRWMIGWEDVEPSEFDEDDEIPEIAVDIEEKSLSLCNIECYTQIAYITVYETGLLSSRGDLLRQGSTTDNDGKTLPCVTFIVLCPPRTFAHLCYLDVADEVDMTEIRIESDVREWNQHPNPMDEHSETISFPLCTKNGPFLCTQGENGELTHFFSGNLHAFDFACPIGTPLLAAVDGIVFDANDNNTLTGIAVSNLFQWNSIIIQQLHSSNEKDDHDEQGKSIQTTTTSTTTTNKNHPLFVEYVHIQKTLVRKGDKVKKGQIIGYSGSVGFSPEPHLHFSAFRSSNPTAPTVRVKIQALPLPSSQQEDKKDKNTFIPKAGIWYDETGPVPAPSKQFK